MKINYDDIITKANARKDALKAFGAKAQHADERYNELLALLEYFTDLVNSARRLDDEAKKLVNTDFANQIEQANTVVKLFHLSVVADEYRRTPLKNFIKALSND